jgi:hypothetical protein
MLDSYDELLAMCRTLCGEPLKHSADDSLLALRTACRTDMQARESLLRYIHLGDGRQRILAAEALSWTGAYADDAVEVLAALTEVLAEMDDVSEHVDWAVMGLGALSNYGAFAARAAPSYWPLLYKPGPLNVRLYATKLAARLATEGETHWTVWCLLCTHQEEIIRTCAQTEFKDWHDREGI